MATKCRVIKSGLCLITQPYHSQGGGWTYAHWGIDLVDFSRGYSALDYITAHSDGTVVGIVTSYTGEYHDGSYGNYVLLQHPNGFSTIYAHLAYGTVKVRYGEKVKKGQILAYMDNTGESNGGHLHFEVRDKSGAKIDPARYLNSELPGMKTKVWLQKWHFYDENGKMLTGWQKDKDKWYYLDKNGIMLTGWFWDNYYKSWFLLASDGRMLTGWQKVNGKWYYMQPNNDGKHYTGAMRVGWVFDPAYKKWFYTDSSGAMVTGWITLKGKKYYLCPVSNGNQVAGEMFTGTHIIDGITYHFDSSGALIS